MNWITLKVVAERMKQYVAWIRFILILYIFIDQSPYPFWMVLPIAGVGILILGYLDYRFIFPREMNKISTRNPFMRELKKDLDEIKQILKERD